MAQPASNDLLTFDLVPLGAIVGVGIVAAVLSKGLVLSRGGWRRFAPAAREGMVQSMTVRDDGGFDCEEAMGHWAAASRL